MVQKIVIILSIIIAYGCISKKNVFPSEPSMIYTEQELNILNALEFVKADKKDCNDTCFILIDNVFNYFDNCLYHNFQNDRVQFDYDSTKIINIPSSIFLIEGVGEVVFTSRKENETYDYKFSPIAFNPKSRSIIGQVKKKIGRKFEYSTKIIGNKVYFSNSLEYYYTCDYWH